MTTKLTSWEFTYQELAIELPVFDEKPLSVYVEEHAQNYPDFPASRYLNVDISCRELNSLD